MPPIFKALATIAVWVMFIFALVGIVWSGVMWPRAPSPLVTAAFFGVWFGTLFLSIVAMKLRQMLE